MNKYLAFDIGGTKIKYGILNDNGDILMKDAIDSDARSIGGNGIIEKIIFLIELYAHGDEISGVCISSHGMIDSINGVVLFADEHLIPGFTGMNIKEIIQSRTKIPCEIENDVNCAALGELWKGQNIKEEYVSMITIGTGIGGCLMLNGRIISGAAISAGEIGKMIIPGGRFEDIASTYAVSSSLERYLSLPEGSIDGKIMIREYLNGSPIFKSAINKMSDNIALGISNLCYTFNPGAVIVGGGIMERDDIFYDKINAGMKKYLNPHIKRNTKLYFASLGNDAGIVGAVRNFKNKHDKK